MTACKIWGGCLISADWLCFESVFQKSAEISVRPIFKKSEISFLKHKNLRYNEETCMNGWNWQLTTGFLHDITIILFRLLYLFSCRAMVLGSFQCRGGRPTTLAYGRAGACCACSRCGTGGLFFCCCFYVLFFCLFFISSVLSSFPNASYLGRRPSILKYCGAGRCNPAVVVSYYWRRARKVLVNHLVGRNLSRNSING